MKRVAFGLAALFITGCTVEDVETPDACNAHANQSLEGEVISDFAAVSALAPKVRLIFPGDLVTMDFQEDRLNVEFDQDDRVTRVYCG